MFDPLVLNDVAHVVATTGLHKHVAQQVFALGAHEERNAVLAGKHSGFQFAQRVACTETSKSH
jgi:hypothetical protein